MRVRSAQPAEERSLQEKSPKWVRQPTPSARLRDQSHDNRTTRRAQGWWTGTILAPSIQADAALRPKIGGILKSGFGLTPLPIYQCGAAHAQAVSPPYQC
jgi:hypothetical protein